MRIDIMTLFPDFVDHVLSESIIGRARAKGILDIRTWQIRDYSRDKHRRVDDTPYGGGRGMLMAAPPIYRCYEAVMADTGTPEERAVPDPALELIPDTEIDDRPAPEKPENTYVVYMSPRGTVLREDTAKRLAQYDRLIILCGHYEGVDERIIEEIVDEEISIGDYVLTGGELPACILADCVGRLVDGVLAMPECYENESFSDDLLEYPQYTRPVSFRGRKVPDVLQSGHHANIEKWRGEKSLELTKARRPDLLEKKD